MTKNVPPDTDSADQRAGDAIRRRTVLAATGIVAVTVLGAGCTGDDAGAADSGGSNDPAEDSTETPDEETETTTEQETETEEPTTTAAEEVPGDLQGYATEVTDYLGRSLERMPAFRSTDKNQCHFRPLDGSDDQYLQVIDVWVTEDFPALAGHSPASLVEETDIEDGLSGLTAVLSVTNDSYKHIKDMIGEQLYRVQQGPDTGEPYASLRVGPTFGEEFYERTKQEFQEETDESDYEKGDFQEYWRDQFGAFLKDNLNIHA